MQETKKYLNEVLGIEVVMKRLQSARLKNLPLFIRQMYDFYQVRLLEREMVFLKSKSDETASPDRLRKHLQTVEKALDAPVVFIFPFLQAYNRKRLIRKRIAFIIPGKQMFIPWLMIDLRELGHSVPSQKEKLLPAAQCLLIYHLLKEDLGSFPLKTVAEKLHYTQATVTRAVQALVEKELANKKIQNREIRIRFKYKDQELWGKALPVLQNPVKKACSLEELPDKDIVYVTSFSALAHYTDLAADQKRHFAMAEKDFQWLKKERQIRIIPGNNGNIYLEVWKYPPGILADNGMVDPLSLYMTLKEEKDERIELALEKMISHLW